jgi:Tol biopolymer transport system component
MPSYNRQRMDSGGVSPQAVEAHLERVLGSATFRGAERSRRLLRFVVEETLHGRADGLKDYTLGAEALGRGDEFDPRTDPIARVEMSRLRSRLDLYYATVGASDEVRIVVPKGGYIPRFEMRSSAADTPPAAASVPMDAGIAAGPREQAVPAKRWSAVWTPVAAAVLAATATWWLANPWDRRADSSEIRLELTTPSTTDPASLAISPDGRTLVFLAAGGDVPRLWTRGLADERARSLAGTEYASFPFWSPDGRVIGFFAEGKVKAIDLQTRVVRTLSAAPVPAGAAWSRDGVILHALVPDGPLFRTTASGAALEHATQLATGQTGHRGPTFLPDGRRFLFYAAGRADTRGVYVGELGTFRVRRLVDADAPAVFVSPGHVLYVQNTTLVARGFDPATATLRGEPFTMVEHIAADPNAGLAAVSASSSGTIAYRTGRAGQQRQLIWLDRHGKELTRIGAPEERGPSYGSLSPDGRRLAMQRAMDGNTDIWLVDLERGPSVRFTSDPQADIAPMWSPRGDRIAFASQVDGVFDLFDKPVDRGEHHLLLHTGEAKQITDWSRDGRYLLYRSVRTTPSADMDIWAVALDGSRAPFAVVRTPFEERDAQFSPDGTWIAYQSNESGRHEVYIQPLTGGGERSRVSPNGGVQARWRADGRELFYLTPEGQLMAVPIESVNGGRSLRPGAAAALFQTRLGAIQGVALHSYVVAPDGERFLLDSVVEQQAAPIALILNWKRPGQ